MLLNLSTLIFDKGFSKEVFKMLSSFWGRVSLEDKHFLRSFRTYKRIFDSLFSKTYACE